jgi:hypothetical protein
MTWIGSRIVLLQFQALIEISWVAVMKDSSDLIADEQFLR